MDIYLRSDGSFKSSSSFGGAVDASGGFAAVGNKSGPRVGQWRITGMAGQPALELRFQDGSTASFTPTTNARKTFLNGTRYFVVENPVCR